MRTLPIDRSREFRINDYPQQPHLYRPLRHFSQRRREDSRFLTSEVIEACITDGDRRDNQDGCCCFRKVWGDGVAYYLIAGFHEDGYRVLVTGWPHVHHRQAALDSGVWTEPKLDAIEVLNEQTNPSFGTKYPDYDAWIQQEQEA